MKITTLFLSLVCSYSAFAQATLKPTLITMKEGYVSSPTLTNQQQQYYYYDDNYRCYKERYDLWNGLDWDLSSQRNHSFNAEGKLVSTMVVKWNPVTSTWNEDQRHSYEYNDSNQLIFSKFEKRGTIPNTWIPLLIQIYQYDVAGNLIERKFETYNFGEIYSGSITKNTYDENNRLIEVIYQKWANNTYTNDQKKDFIYNGTFTEYDTTFTRKWIDSTANWGYATIRSIVTVSDTQRSELIETCPDSVWIRSSKNTILYQTDGQIVEKKTEIWKPVPGIWKLKNKLFYAYNSDGSLAKITYTNTTDNEVPYTAQTADYEYGIYLNIPSIPLKASVKLMPNPTHQFIEVSIDNEQAAALYLFDMNGALVQQAQTDGQSTQISLIGQAAGTYFLHIVQNGATKVMPVVKM